MNYVAEVMKTPGTLDITFTDNWVNILIIITLNTLLKMTFMRTC